MKAVVVQTPGSVSIEDVPEPILGEYDALCETLAVGICSGTDNHVVEGSHFEPISYPTILGHEGIGRVVSISSKVRHIHVGDLVTRVFNKLPQNSGYSLYHGALAEKSIVTDWVAMREDGLPEEMWRPYTVHRILPHNTDPVSATMIITWRETYAFLSRMALSKSDTLLIIGSGGNALSFAEHAQNNNLKTVIIGSPRRAELFNTVGVFDYVSYKEGDFLTSLTKKGVTSYGAIIDAVGDANTLNKVIPLLRNGGKVGVYGLNSFGTYNLTISKTQGDIMYFNGTQYDEGSAHDKIMEYINGKKLKAEIYLSKEQVYPLEAIKEALAACKERNAVKSVVKIKD